MSGVHRVRIGPKEGTSVVAGDTGTKYSSSSSGLALTKHNATSSAGQIFLSHTRVEGFAESGSTERHGSQVGQDASNTPGFSTAVGDGLTEDRSALGELHGLNITRGGGGFNIRSSKATARMICTARSDPILPPLVACASHATHTLLVVTQWRLCWPV